MWNAAILLASVRSRRLQRVQRHPQTSHAPLLRAPSVRTRVAVSSTSAAHPHPRTAAPGDRLSRPHCLGLRPPRLSLVTLQGSPGEARDTAPRARLPPGAVCISHCVAVVVLCMLGRAMWPARPALLVVYVTAVCSTFVGGLYHQYSGSEESAAWFVEEAAVLLAWVTVVAARRAAIGQLKLCCASMVGCVIFLCMAILFLERNCDSTAFGIGRVDSVLGEVSYVLANFFVFMLALVLLFSCCRLPCCETAGNERRALGVDVPLMPMGPI